MVTTSITGVSGSVTASKATAATSQTSVSGFANNTTTDENLTISGVLPTTQTTTQFTFADVTVPKAATATTVATGELGTDADGAAVVTAIGSSTTTALTGLGTSTTAEVLKSNTTMSLSNQTISLTAVATSGTGKVQVATGIKSATATNGNVAWAD